MRRHDFDSLEPLLAQSRLKAWPPAGDAVRLLQAAITVGSVTPDECWRRVAAGHHRAQVRSTWGVNAATTWYPEPPRRGRDVVAVHAQPPVPGGGPAWSAGA